MNFKTTFILLIIFLGIGAYLFFTTRGDRADDEAIRERAERVLELEAGDVVQVTIAPAAGEQTVFEKADGQWRMVEPVSAPAAEWQVDALVQALTDLKREGRVDREESEAAKAVRDHPQYRVELVTGDGRTHAVAVGAKSLVGNTTYVQVDGRGRIYVVPGEIHEQLAKPASAYRDTQLVAAGAEQMTRIELERAAGAGVALRKADQTWQITQPTTMPADQPAAQALAGTLGMLRATAFAEDRELGPPRLTVRVATDGGEPTAIRFGQWDDILESNVLVQVDDGPVAKVPAATFEQVNKTVLDLRSREVVSIEPGTVRAITVKRELAATTQPSTRPASSASLTLRRQTPGLAMGPATPATQDAATQPAAEARADAKWVAEGDAGGVSDAAVEALLQQLNPLRVTAFVAAAPGEEVIGRYSVRIDTGEGDAGMLDLMETRAGGMLGTYDGVTFEAPAGLAEAVRGLIGVER